MPLPDTGGLTTAQRTQIDRVYQAAMAKGDVRLANDWVTFANSFWPNHPGLSLQQVFDAFIGTEAGGGIAKGIAQTGTLVGSTGQAAAKAAANGLPGQVAGAENKVIGALTSVPDFLSRLTSINTWIRVGEFVLGTLLILAGALKLSGQSADLGDIAKLAKFVK